MSADGDGVGLGINSSNFGKSKAVAIRLHELGYNANVAATVGNTKLLKSYAKDRNIKNLDTAVNYLFSKGGINYNSLSNCYNCSPYGDNVTYLNSGVRNLQLNNSTQSSLLTNYVNNEHINSYVRHYGMLQNGVMPLPVNPTELTEQVNANWANTNIPGRSADYLHYASTGNRSISFSLKLHVDLGEIIQVNNNGSTYRSGVDIESFVNFMQALCYPNYSGSGILPPVCKLVIEDVIDARVVFNSVSITKSGPMRKYTGGNRAGNKTYTLYDCNFSIVEMPTKVLTADNIRNR